MSEPLTPAQADSLRIMQAGAEATIKLAEMNAAYDALNASQAVTPLSAAIDEVLSRTNQRSTIGQFLRSGNTGGELRKDQIAVAETWRDELMRDPAAQERLLAGDPNMRAKLLLHAVWAPGPHEL